jgi:DNA-binding CsgD family transcriptional regulator
MGVDPAESLLDLVAETNAHLELDQFRSGLLRALGRTMPSDWSSITDINYETGDVWGIVEPEIDAALLDRFAPHAATNPIAAHYARTRDARATRFSDVCTPQELHATPVYREFYAALGIEHQIAFALPSDSSRVLAVVLSRRTHDYTDAERDLLERARPHLVQAYRNAVSYTELRALKRGPGVLAERLRAAGLTGRETEVLLLSFEGLTAEALAGRLGISPRTVDKHLQRCYGVLGATSRLQALGKARALPPPK